MNSLLLNLRIAVVIVNYRSAPLVVESLKILEQEVKGSPTLRWWWWTMPQGMIRSPF